MKGHGPVVTATWEAEAGGTFEPKNLKTYIYELEVGRKSIEMEEN